MPPVLLFSRQPLARRPLQEWLDDTENVVLFTTAKAVSGAEDVLEKHFPRHRLVDDYYSWEAERAAEEAARQHGAGLVACTSEHDVLRAGRLRDRLGVPGQGSASATAYRDKVTMKRLAQAAGLRVPAFTAVDGPLDLLDFADAQGYPVVTKPRLGAGADGVRVLRGAPDVAAFLAAQVTADPPYLPGQWMAESFVSGDFCHVDGIMAGGRVVHCWPSRYSSGLHEHVRDQACVTSMLLSPADPRHAALMELTAGVIAALPPAALPLAFHLEAWIGADGEAVLCEIASRAGGGPIAAAYELVFGVHLAREGLRAQCGAELTLAGQPPPPEAAWGWLVIPPGRGTLVPPREPCPVPGARLTIEMKAGDVGAGVVHAADAAATAIVSAGTAAEVSARLDEVAAWWQQNANWT